MACKKLFLLLLLPFFLFCKSQAIAQSNKSSLTIEKIMLGPRWIGISPDNIRFSEDSQKLYFDWNPENNMGDSLYMISLEDKKPVKVSSKERRTLPPSGGVYNRDRTKKAYISNGDLFLLDLKSGAIRQITNTVDSESSPSFLEKDKKISYVLHNNLYTWELASGHITQITDFRNGKQPEEKSASEAGQWLEGQVALFEVLQNRKQKKEQSEKQTAYDTPKGPKTIYFGHALPDNLQASPDARFVTYNLYTDPGDQGTIVPNYVSESGFTEELPARPKVGSPQPTMKMYIYDRQQDTVYQLQTDAIPGITVQNSAARGKETDSVSREILVYGPFWSDDGSHNYIVIRAMDHKDRWIMTLDLASGKPSLLDRQHDNAWIAGPGIGWYDSAGDHGWLPDNRRMWFQSEESGYSHIYTAEVNTGEKEAVTKGDFEVYNPIISRNGKYWYYSSNEVHPGERHFYRKPIDGRKEALQLTSMEGHNEVTLSPDERYLAIRYSSSNRPWELYLMENKAEGQPVQITESLSREFQAYPWRKPAYITFKSSDGEKVHARLYKPENPGKNAPAVVFVHGAGYLQNAHKWWSLYFREYMFHNFLVDNGYTVLDIDYRGSAGYGRDWRTGIYRHMGGKDLSDQIDGARYLIEEHDIDPQRLGIYGGSYGGFITLMAMFTKPGVFAAGAALRSVTDWAHYNHPYTSNILNEPASDSLAYTRSSPIYYADGLKGALLICHGMIDTNVHFQDVVRLVQRLISLGKENWELAVYPLESHGFKEPSSWTDEYKRIYQLFERNLKSK